MGKRRVNNFLRSFYITLVIMLCIGFGFWGICKAYENMRLISYGEYRQAIEFKDGKFKFFDYSLNFSEQAER